ncbi:hypothetical protein NDU88_005985 [Pleurodeles waltl]|uniref:Uncharacterized protein n=1 Tax=Pleurodeles waltl TaxID=8319 RepID=A0AAV7PH00_PLEWA|nr:hypothetical protein NDU88_005985 [Pleurodeles waltl]
MTPYPCALGNTRQRHMIALREFEMRTKIVGELLASKQQKIQVPGVHSKPLELTLSLRRHAYLADKFDKITAFLEEAVLVKKLELRKVNNF